MDYLILKYTHMTLAALSLFGFVLRWSWRMRASPLAQLRVTRIAPHVIDTLFLLAGILLTLQIHQYPGTVPWLSAKVAGLVAYIVLGMVAMKAGSRPVRVIVFLLAVAVFAWVVSVARTKTPLGLLQALF